MTWSAVCPTPGRITFMPRSLSFGALGSALLSLALPHARERGRRRGRMRWVGEQAVRAMRTSRPAGRLTMTADSDNRFGQTVRLLANRLVPGTHKKNQKEAEATALGSRGPGARRNAGR